MRTVLLAWTFFLIMGVFTSIVVPLGEGFDEPWHFAYIQYVAQTGKLPSGPSQRLSVDLEAFLARHPAGWRLQQIFPSLNSQEEYWHQPESARKVVDQELREISFTGIYREAVADFTEQYESHQPPLYYLLTAPVFSISSRLVSVADTFLILRLFSLLIASAVVPLSYFLAARVTTETHAKAVCVLTAMFPGIYPDVARVSNDALAVPLAAATFLVVAEHVKSRSERHLFALSLLLLAGLWTKAFFIPILVAIVLALIWMKQTRAMLWTTTITAVGWLWYIRNVLVTGSLTGLPETVSASTTITSSLAAIGGIRWLDVARLVGVSHIWMGNWSLLQYRSWIYETMMLFFAIGAFGFLLYWKKRGSPTVHVLLLIYAMFGASLAYYATQVFQQTGLSVIQGWYLSPMIPIEAIIFVAGTGFIMSSRVWTWSVAWIALCFLVMSVYGTAFIAAPYYSGITEHAASGHLRAYHPEWSHLDIIAERLTRFHLWLPPDALVLLGLVVVAAGFGLILSFIKDGQWSYEASR